MSLTASVDAPAPLDTGAFRDAMGRFATGVAFVTTVADGKPTGLIVNSLTSVSLDPPLIAFCPARSSLTWQRMRRTGRFGVNMLGRQHEAFTRRATLIGVDRFAGIEWGLGDGGVPLITDALAALECEIAAEHPTGDHWIVVGRIEGLRVRPVGEPLIFYAGAFGELQP